jgi:hypothetical protein
MKAKHLFERALQSNPFNNVAEEGLKRLQDMH